MKHMLMASTIVILLVLASYLSGWGSQEKEAAAPMESMSKTAGY